MAPEYCPNCGAAVPARAQACPECGACDETGWNDDAAAGGLGLPDDSFDYNEFVKREFGKKKVLPGRFGWFWASVSLLLAGLLAWWYLR